MGTTAVTVRLDDKQIEYLRYLARFKSVGKPVDFTYIDLIRDALDHMYRVPKDFDPMDMSAASGILDKAEKRFHVI
jgi:hypothetical protein